MGSRRPPRRSERAADRAEARARHSGVVPRPAFSTSTPAGLVELQRTMGNRAVLELLSRARVQPKMEVGPAGDVFEREADDVAEEVMRHLRSGEPDDDRRVRRSVRAQVSRAVDDGVVGMEGGPLGAEVERDVQRARGGGTPLPTTLRQSMEGALGADLSGVRAHVGPEADALNRSIQARAFTVGSDVFFARGEYQPHTSSGQRLLAHELTHVVQQGASDVRRFYVELDDPPGYQWRDNSQWDARKYVVSEKSTIANGWIFHNLYKPRKATPEPEPSRDVPKKPPVQKPKAPKDPTEAAYERLLLLDNNITQKLKGKSGWPRRGEFNALNSQVNDLRKNRQNNPGYALKSAKVSGLLATAEELREALDVWKPEAKRESGPEIGPTSRKGPSDDDPSGWAHVDKPQKVVKRRQTAVDWLDEFGGWDVRSKQSYYDCGSYAFGDEHYRVHISLPMTPQDRTNMITEGTARGMWVGRQIHITIEVERGSPLNARIWYENKGWDRSRGEDKVPKGGERWLLDNSKELLEKSGLSGTVVS